MPRLTEGAAFRQLLEHAGLKTDKDGNKVCAFCGRRLDECNNTWATIREAFERFELTFAVCGVSCGYEFGRHFADAINLLKGFAPMLELPAASDRRRGSGRPTRTHAGTTTGERRKNGTRPPKRPKTRG